MEEIRANLQNAIILVHPPVFTATTDTARAKPRVSGIAMSLTDQLLAALLLYGLPVIFGMTVISAAGAPLPTNLMLIAAGSIVKQGEMTMWLTLQNSASMQSVTYDICVKYDGLS